jgi:hypothetical protein
MKIQNPKFHPTATGRNRNYKNGNEGRSLKEEKYICRNKAGQMNECALPVVIKSDQESVLVLTPSKGEVPERTKARFCECVCVPFFTHTQENLSCSRIRRLALTSSIFMRTRSQSLTQTASTPEQTEISR